MKSIRLVGKHGENKITSIDDIDYEIVKSHKWWVHNAGYAFTKIHNKNVLMHRFILKPPKKMLIDHRNLNRLDNQRHNLRICTMSENCRYKGKHRDNKSGYKGVVFEPRSKKNPWVAYIAINAKNYNLGCFRTKKQAAIAYNKSVVKNHGLFAWVNPIN